tara:strand:- start:1969 stop:2334 length:366 start_codon:yes stop_codon:yes gene_type:complete
MILIFLSPLRLPALTYEWVEVPKTQYGKQLWDQKNLFINEDGSIRIFSKFIPRTKSKISEDILYTMDINCFEKTFRDIGLGSKDFNEYQNIDANWKDPNGDKLILGVIDQVCNFSNKSTFK